MKLKPPPARNTNKVNPLFINKQPQQPSKPPVIFIATPMFGGQCNYMYMISLINVLTKLGQAGIPAMFEVAANESLITKARNILVEGFLRSNATHMLFIDADLGFDGDDIVRMIQADKELIGGQYAKKKINWDVVKQTVLARPDITGPAMDPKTMTRIADAHREAHAFFDVSIDEKTRAYTSEDFTFCKRWRQIGGQVFLAPWTRTVHVGTYEYVCDLAAVAQWQQPMPQQVPAAPAPGQQMKPIVIPSKKTA